MGERRVNADVLITEAGTLQQAVQARRAGTRGGLPRRGAEAGRADQHRYKKRCKATHSAPLTLTLLFNPPATLNK